MKTNLISHYVRRSLAMLGLLALFVPDVRAQVITFQNGLNGYSGNRISLIENNWPDPLSSSPSGSVQLTGTPSGGGLRPGFIGFDNLFGASPGQIAPGLDVTNAKLRLYITDLLVASTGASVLMQPMLTPWAAASSTIWDVNDGASSFEYRYTRTNGVYAPSDYWGTNSTTNGPVLNVDYIQSGLPLTASILLNSNQIGTWMEFDVTSVVQGWQTNSLNNNGWYVYTSDWWSAFTFNSYGNTDSSLRPTLEVSVVPEPSTYAMLALAGAGLALHAVRRRRRQS